MGRSGVSITQLLLQSMGQGVLISALIWTPTLAFAGQPSPEQAKRLSQEAKAEDQTAQQASQSSADDIEKMDSEMKKVCPSGGQAKVVAGDQNAVELKSNYCQAAQQALEAARQSDKVWKVHAGVTAVCTYACASSYISGGVSEIAGVNSCSAANMGGSVAIAVITKDYMGLVMSLGMEFMKGKMGGSGNGADEAVAASRQERQAKKIAEQEKNMSASQKEAAKKQREAAEEQAKKEAEENAKADAEAREKYHKEKEKDTGSCLTAATEGFATYQTYQSVKSSLESAKGNMVKAAEIKGDREGIANALSGDGPDASQSPGSAGSSTATASPGPAEGGSNTGGSSGSSSGGVDSLASTDTSNSDPCKKSSSSFDVATSCALASSSNKDALGNIVNHDKFDGDFKKITHQTPDAFFDEHNSAASALSSLVPNAFGAAGLDMNSEEGRHVVAQLQSGLNDLQQKSLENPGLGAYSSSGGGSSGASDDDDALEDMMMSRLRSGSRDLSMGSSLQVFAGRNPGTKKAIEDDPTVNIFDRITVRYQLLNKRNRYSKW